jgi:hypothetical protein
MALPASSDPCWSKAASGGLARIQTSNLALQLLIKRLDRSSDTPAQKASEIQAFFAKWERILVSEVEQLNRI